MKKPMLTLLSAFVAGAVAWAASPQGHASPSRLSARRVAADITQAADFTKGAAFRHRARVRALPGGEKAPEETGLFANGPVAPVRRAAVPRKSAPARANAITEGLELRASVISSQNFMLDLGMYNVPTADSGTFNLLGYNVTVEYGGYDDGNGKFYLAGVVDYGMGFTVPYLDIYSTDTWEYAGSVDEADYSILCSDNAVDPTSGMVYGCYQDAETGERTWAMANYPAGVSTPIRTLSEEETMWGVACDASGQFYAVLENGNLVKVDKQTGNLETVGDTGLRPYYSTGAAFDDKAGRIIFAYSPVTGTGALWTIDPATAAAELAVEYPDCEQLTCLTVMNTGAEPLAPAAPGLTVSAPEGTMTASYTLTMPTLLGDGSPAEESMTYTLMVDGVTEASGTAAKGEAVSGTVTLAAEGMHAFSAFASNGVGNGARTQVDLFVGSGVPEAPSDVKARTDAEGKVTLTWGKVETSADGGYLDPAAVTYTVTRNGETVAQGIAATEYTDVPPAPESYVKLTYGVMAVSGTKTSEPAEAVAGVGAVVPPYACAFGTDASDHELYSTFNLNDDNSYWYYTPYYKCFKVDYVSDGLSNDDWLLTPAFRLEAGKIYEFTYRICAGSNQYKERYLLAMGRENSPEAMTTVLVPEGELANDPETPLVKTVTITPDATGNYFIGWHAVSPAPCFMIRVDGITMSAPMSSASPAEVTGIELVPDADGHLSLRGSFLAPALNVGGTPLTGTCKVTVKRQGKEAPVAVFESVAAGAPLTFTDSDIPESGTYTYEFLTEGADGTPGRSAKASVYVGPVAPNPVTGIKVEETSVPGTVRLTWTAPATNVEGKPLKAENLTYMVYARGEGNSAVEVLDAPVSACEATVKVCEPDQAAFAILYVEAMNLGLPSEEMPRCEMTPVGRSASLPYAQSFTADDRAAEIVGILAPEGTYAEWSVGNAASAGIPAQDGDDAFLYLYCPTQYATPAFYTGKIDLKGIAEPAITFYHYVLSSNDRNSFEVVAVTPDGTEHPLGEVSHDGAYPDGWNLAHFPLESVKGQTVYIIVRTRINSHYNMAFDHLRVMDLPPVDLAATRLSAPARVEPDKTFTLTATVANLGSTPARDYTVTLMLDGEPVAAATPEAEIGVGAEASVEFTYTLSPLTKETPSFTAKVTVDADADPSNDLSPAAAPELRLPSWPAVADLDAKVAEGDAVALTWSAPSTAGFDAKEVEDFEDATPWADEVEGWTLIDADAQQIGQIENVGMPEAVDMRTRHSFFVFDNNDDDIYFYNPALQPLFAAHSGNRCMAAVYILSYTVDQDDWAISPELSGEAQTVSFFARSYHPEYPDLMEVLYSTENSTDPADFVSLCPDGPVEVPQLVDALGNAAYTSYEYALPAGARRLAIRAANMAGSGFMLMFDDVKMRVANATLEIDGYDIYRNGVKIASLDASQTSFTDARPSSAKVEYHVVVRYNRGNSGASNGASALLEGVEGVEAGISMPVIRAEGHAVIVTGASADTPVAVHAADGRTLYAGQGNAVVPLPAGLYIVTAGPVTAKLPLP